MRLLAHHHASKTATTAVHEGHTTSVSSPLPPPPRQRSPATAGARPSPHASPPRDTTNEVLSDVFRTELARTHTAHTPLRLRGAGSAQAGGTTRNAGAGTAAEGASGITPRPPAHSTLRFLAHSMVDQADFGVRKEHLSRIEFMFPTLPRRDRGPYVEQHLSPVLLLWMASPPPVVVLPSTPVAEVERVSDVWSFGERLLRLFVQAEASVRYVRCANTVTACPPPQCLTHAICMGALAQCVRRSFVAIAPQVGSRRCGRRG